MDKPLNRGRFYNYVRRPKYHLVAISVVLFMLGAIVLFLSIILRYNEDILKEVYGYEAVLGMSYGSFLIISSMIGTGGVQCASRCMVYVYLVMLFSLIVTEMFLVHLIFVDHEDRKQARRERMMYLVENYFNRKGFSYSGSVSYIDMLQYMFKCCGVEDVYDWKKVVPNSCCSEDTRCYYNNSYEEGCADVYTKKLRKQTVELFYVTIPVVLAELTACAYILYITCFRPEELEDSTGYRA